MTATTDFTFVTCSKLPAGDPDDLLALDILRCEGFSCAVVDWRNADFDFSKSQLTVLRSTWDYHLHFESFQHWLAQVSLETTLLNDHELVKNNLDKKYLLELGQRGITVCPTVYIEGGQKFDAQALESAVSSFDLSLDARVIIKPAIGLSTFGVNKFDTRSSTFTEQALLHCQDLLSRGALLLQPYLPQVESYGERSLIYIDGVYSHSIRKTAFQKLAVAGQAGEESKTATTKEIEFGYKVLATLPQKPLYARVDVVGDGGSEILLLELELTEPSLYLSMAEGSANRFADALVKRLTKA